MRRWPGKAALFLVVKDDGQAEEACLIALAGLKREVRPEVDQAASRIRQEVDQQANIIVGAIIEPALEQAMRVSVVATGIDQSANRLMHAQSFAEPVLPQTLRRLRWTGPRERPSARRVESTDRGGHRVRDSASSSARHPISRADGAASDSGRGDALRSASNSTAARQIRRRSVGKATGSKSIGLN